MGKKISDLSEEEKATLIGSGREIALSLMNSARQDADSPEQIANQLFALHVCACHILATSAFNMQMNKKGSAYIFLDKYFQEAKDELKFIFDEYEIGNVTNGVEVNNHGQENQEKSETQNGDKAR